MRHVMGMRRIVGIVVLGAALAVGQGAAQADPELKGTPAELSAYLATVPDTVVIVGESEVKVQADLAWVNIRIITESRTMRDALSKNVAVRQDIRDELKKAGIPEDAITGNKFSSSPESGIFTDKVKSYKVDNSIRVKVLDENQLRLVAVSIDGHNEASFEGMEFENSKDEASKNQALAQACQAATAKKLIYETQLEVSLKPRSFVEGQVLRGSPAQSRRPYIDGSDSYSKSSSLGAARLAPGDGGRDLSVAAVTQFAEITYRATVQVTYQLLAR